METYPWIFLFSYLILGQPDVLPAKPSWKVDILFEELFTKWMFLLEHVFSNMEELWQLKFSVL